MLRGTWVEKHCYLTCSCDNVTIDAAEVVELETSGQREVGDHLNGAVLVPPIDQVVHRPTV